MLVLTMGDPAGIGGELTVQLLEQWGTPPFVALDNPERLAALNNAPVKEVFSVAEAEEVYPHAIPVLRVNLPAPVQPGTPAVANAPAVVESIRRAVELAMLGEVGGVVTNPISKATLYDANFPFPGHTEYLSALTFSKRAVMMLAAPELRVIPVTIHVSLRKALEELNTDLIVETVKIVYNSLRQDWGIVAPRLAVAGLNPHAGENGSLGMEEQSIIRPAVKALCNCGIDASGPWSPDAMFTPAARSSYDAAICMYHDQALIPLKTLDRDRGVNITLGLPIVRTSPDHGTAFDIAGTGRANASSLLAALKVADQLAARRRLSREDGSFAKPA